MLVLRDVSRSLGKDLLLNRVSLDFPADIPTAVLGLAPPGREALLRLLEGADKPKAGSVRLDGVDVVRARRRIVRVGPNGVKVSGQRVGKVVGAELAARAGLAERLDAAVSELALAERVRLAVAAAVAAKPGLILLDSPASELDADVRARFVADLSSIVADARSVIVLVGVADEAMGLAGRVVVVSHGRVVQVGAAADVMAAPATVAAAVAMSAPVLNVVPMMSREGAGVLADGSVFQAPDGVPVPVTGAFTLAFHPDDVMLERKTPAAVRFVVRAASGVEEGIAGKRYARVAFAGSAWLIPEPAIPPAPGMMLNVFVNRAKLMVFDAEGKAVR